MSEQEKPIVPEVCDRLKCKLPSCYGWDLCRQARAELTREEQTKWVRGLAVMWNIDPDKVAPLPLEKSKPRHDGFESYEDKFAADSESM